MDARDSKAAPTLQTGVPSHEVTAQLNRILASGGFRNSQRRSDLLRWLVTRVLSGESEPLKEHQIGMAVFGKKEYWDPRVEPVVRVEYNRVKQKLREFYENEGSEDPIVIEFSTRGYVPAFSRRAPAAPVLDQPAAEEPVSPEPVAKESEPQNATRRFPLAAVALGIAILASAGWYFLTRDAQPPLTSVAVLPFLDLSQNHSYEYLSDGFTDELTNALAEVAGLRVVARTSAFQFRGKAADVREIGRVLRAGAIVEGSILRSGDSIRVVVQLNRAGDGFHLWAATYQRQMKDILRVQDEIAHSVAEALRVQLVTTPPPAFDPGEEAYSLYLHGLNERSKSTPDSLRRAIDYFSQAIRLSPRYAKAYAELGRSYLTLGSYGRRDQADEFRKSKKYLEDSLALDSNLGSAESTLAYVNYVLDWDWPAAEAHFLHAMRTASDSGTRNTFAFALMTRGRFQEAREQYRAALESDPLNLTLRVNFAVMLAQEGAYAESARELRSCLDRNPKFFPALLNSAFVSVEENRPAAALDYLTRADQLVPSSPLVLPAKAAALFEAGNKDDALALLKTIEQDVPAPGFVRYHLAIVHAVLRDPDGVFHWLEQSADAHEQQILYIRVAPKLAPYQRDPRMIALERRVGLIR